LAIIAVGQKRGTLTERKTVTTYPNFSIRKTFLLPLGLLLLLSLALFVLILVKGEPLAKVIILGLIILPVAGFFFESVVRRVQVDDTRISIHKLFREKSLLLADITAVDTVLVKKRAFLTLSTEEDFIILSNAYADFPAFVRTILQRVPAGTISEETRKMAVAPPVKSTDIVSCWIAVALMAFILYIQMVSGQ